MKFDRLKPCKSCPYKRSSKLGFWDAEHFTKLLRDTNDVMQGAKYLCHEDGKKPLEEAGFCIGWLLNQREANIPSIQMRFFLMTNKSACDQLREAQPDGEMFSSVYEMCEANLEAINETQHQKNLAFLESILRKPRGRKKRRRAVCIRAAHRRCASS